MPLGSATKTAQQVSDYVKRQFGDESGAQITDADIVRFINAGQRTIARRNRIIKGIATVPTVVGTREYTFPATPILQVELLQYAGKPLTYYSFQEAQDEIMNGDPTFTATGTPTLWYEWGNSLFVYPAPVAVGNLSLYYVGYPVDIDDSDLSQVLSIPDSYYESLVQYVMQQAYEMDDDPSQSQMKSEQLDTSLTGLQEDEQRYNRGTYPVILDVDGDY